MKRRGAPVGHPPYRQAVLTARLQLLLTPELKEQIESAAKQRGTSVQEWCREALHSVLAG